MDNNDKYGFIEVVSVSGLLISGFFFLSAMLNQSRLAMSLSLLGFSGSTGGFVASALFDRTRQKNDQIRKLTVQISEKDAAIAASEKQASLLNTQMDEAKRTIAHLQTLPPPVDRSAQIVQRYEEQIRNLQLHHQSEAHRIQRETAAQIESDRIQSRADLERLQAEMVDADTRISEFETRFVQNAQATLSDALSKIHDRVSNLVQDNLRKADQPDSDTYDSHFHDRITTLAEEVTVLQASYVKQIMSLSDFLEANSILDCSDEALSVLMYLMDDYTNIKVKVINALKARAIRELQATITAYKEAQLVPKSELERIIENLRLRLQEYELEAQQHQQNVLAIASEYESQTAEDDRVVRGYIDKLATSEHEIQRLKQELAAAKSLKRFHPGAWAWGADIGNSVIDYLYAQNIPCDAIPLNFTPSDTHLTLSLECRTELGLETLRKEASNIQKGMEAAKGWADVKIELEGRVVKVNVQYAKRAIAKVKPESVLIRPLSEWRLYLGSELHWAIFAATQSGKTTLIDELDALLYGLLNGEVEFNAITLKTDGNRDDEKSKRFVFPKFKQDNLLYYEAMCEVEEEIESRKLILAANPNHRYKRFVFQWDEYGEHYRNGGIREATKKVLISALQVGAGLSSEYGKGIQITFIAQNPLVSQLGLNRPDLANCCLIVVGEKNIRLFLGSDSDNHGLDSEDVARLNEELSIFKEASRKAVEKIRSDTKLTEEEMRLAIAKCPERYYSLIIPSKGGLKPIILYNPKPGEFTNPLTGGTAKDAAETCDHEFKKARTRLIENNTIRQRELVCKKCGFKQKTTEPVDAPKPEK